jgi:hypothetical protein
LFTAPDGTEIGISVAGAGSWAGRWLQHPHNRGIRHNLTAVPSPGRALCPIWPTATPQPQRASDAEQAPQDFGKRTFLFPDRATY